MDKTLRSGITLATLGALCYASGPFVSSGIMPSLMTIAALLGSAGLVLVAWTITNGGNSDRGLFWTGTAFIVASRLNSVLSNLLGVTAFDNEWVSHLGLALGALGPVILLVPVARTALEPAGRTASA
jgi:hypothetical protein